jgi:hypothetical protein
MLIRRFGLTRFCGLVLLTLMTCTVVTVALPHDPYIRFQSLNDTIYKRMGWIYERIHFDETPIDVVFVGSSRTGAGIYPTLLEPALAARGVETRVVNFALPSAGLDIRETILEELLANRTVKLVVFDVVEALPRDGHEAYGNVASVGDLLCAPLLVNRTLPRNLMGLPLRQINLALATWMPEAFGFQGGFDPALYAGSTVDARTMLNFAENNAILDTPEHAATLETQSKQRYRLIQPPILPESLGWIEFGVSRSYIERITMLAKAKDVKVAFLFLPFYKGYPAPIEEAWLSGFGPVWNAGFLRDDPRNFQDSGHLAASPEVKAAVTEWVADKIAPLVRQ